MSDYNFWADLLDTFQSSPDWIKAIWLLVPPAFILALIAMAMRLRLESKRVDSGFDGELICSVRRDGKNRLHIVDHTTHLEASPALLCLDPPNMEDRHRASVKN
jgi:hypothetical protein